MRFAAVTSLSTIFCSRSLMPVRSKDISTGLNRASRASKSGATPRVAATLVPESLPLALVRSSKEKTPAISKRKDIAINRLGIMPRSVANVGPPSRNAPRCVAKWNTYVRRTKLFRQRCIQSTRARDHHGKSILGWKTNCRKRRLRRHRGQPVFPSLHRKKGISEIQRAHHYLPLERHRA